MKTYLFIVLIALSSAFFVAQAAHDETTLSVSSSLSSDATSYSFRSFPSSSSLSTSSSLSDYDFNEQIEYEPFEDSFLFVSNPVVDLLDDDDDDFIPEVKVSRTRPVVEHKAAPFLFSSSSSSDSSSSSTSSTSGDASPSELTFSTTRNRRAARASAFGGSSSSGSSSSSSSSSDKKKKRDASESPCDFAASECKACKRCADDFDPARCICVVGTRTTPINLGTRLDDVCVAVARESRLQENITTGAGNDCVAIAGRVDGTILLGAGHDDFVVVAGGALVSGGEVHGDEGDDRFVVRAGGYADQIEGGADSDKIYVEEGAGAEYIYGHEDPATPSVGSDTVVIAGNVYEAEVGESGNHVRGFLTSTGFVSEDFEIGIDSDEVVNALMVLGYGSTVGYDVDIDAKNIVLHFGGQISDGLFVRGVLSRSDIFAVLYSESTVSYGAASFAQANIDLVVHNRFSSANAFEVQSSDTFEYNVNIEIHDYVAIAGQFHDNGVGQWRFVNAYIGSHFVAGELDLVFSPVLREMNLFIAPHSTYDYAYAEAVENLNALIMGPSSTEGWILNGATGTVRFTGESHVVYDIYAYGGLDVFLSNMKLSYYYGDAREPGGTGPIAAGQRIALGNFCIVYEFSVQESSADDFTEGSVLFVQNGSYMQELSDPSGGASAEDIFIFENNNTAVLGSCDAGFDHCPPQFENDKKKKKKRAMKKRSAPKREASVRVGRDELLESNAALAEETAALADQVAALKAEIKSLRA